MYVHTYIDTTSSYLHHKIWFLTHCMIAEILKKRIAIDTIWTVAKFQYQYFIFKN